jgi:hypothetical protein
MDISKIAVGQYVDLVSGIWDGGQGKVVKVTAEGVEVQMSDKLRHFDMNGRSYLPESDPSYNPYNHPDSILRCDGTFECGPWFIVDYYSLVERKDFRLESRYGHDETGGYEKVEGRSESNFV